MKRSELEKCLGKKVEVHLKKDVEDSKHVYIGMLTKCSSLTPERNLYRLPPCARK
jgi:hypothetical protein